MKPRENKPEIVYRIIDRATGEARGSYIRAYCDEFDFDSAEMARDANYDGEFTDKSKYKIAQYRVTYELLDGDVDGAEETPLYTPPPPPPPRVIPANWLDLFMERLDAVVQEKLASAEAKQSEIFISVKLPAGYFQPGVSEHDILEPCRQKYGHMLTSPKNMRIAKIERGWGFETCLQMFLPPQETS